MPKILLHLEGLAILLASLFAYHFSNGSWGWFAILFLAPDLSMLGYLAGSRIGSVVYNIAHSYALVLLLLFVIPDEIAMIWLAHIGFDRLLGYGLKYPTSFKDTHLQRV